MLTTGCEGGQFKQQRFAHQLQLFKVIMFFVSLKPTTNQQSLATWPSTRCHENFPPGMSSVKPAPRSVKTRRRHLGPASKKAASSRALQEEIVLKTDIQSNIYLNLQHVSLQGDPNHPDRRPGIWNKSSTPHVTPPFPWQPQCRRLSCSSSSWLLPLAPPLPLPVQQWRSNPQHVTAASWDYTAADPANERQCYGHVTRRQPIAARLAEWGRHFARAGQADRLSMWSSHLGWTGKIVSGFENGNVRCFWP